MFKRLLGCIKNHPVKSFLLILFFPIYGTIIYFIVMASYAGAIRWYYEEFPVSSLAVWLFAEPGEDTLMFRYRLGDRLLYVRSDVAQPARYSGRENTRCNPLWGECRVFPFRIMMYREVGGNKVCIGKYFDCPSSPDIPYDRTVEFVIWSFGKNNNDSDLMKNSCDEDFSIFSYGNYRGYNVGRAYGRRQTICPLIQPDGALDSLLTAMETGNYDRFPRNRKNLPTDRRPEGRN